MPLLPLNVKFIFANHIPRPGDERTIIEESELGKLRSAKNKSTVEQAQTPCP
jgi:hypothetical protein